MPSLAYLLFLLFVVRECVGCIPTVSPDDDDIMAQLEEMAATMAMLETTATCGAACQPTTSLGTTVPSTSTTTTTTTTPTTTTTTTSTTTTSTTTTTTTATCSAGTCTCLSGDTLYENSCYRIITTGGTQSFAANKARCGMLNGGDLCIITSMAENDHVADVVTDYCGACNVQMAGQRTSINDPYFWPDGVPFSSTWTNWAGGEPSDTPNDQLCVLWLTNLLWIAVSCTATNYPCCEYPPMPIG